MRCLHIVVLLSTFTLIKCQEECVDIPVNCESFMSFCYSHAGIQKICPKTCDACDGKDKWLAQGDILLPEGVMPEDIINEDQKQDPLSMFTLVKKRSMLWPDGPDGYPEVPYRILLKDPYYRNIVKQAMEIFEKETCIKFKKVEEGFTKPYLSFKDKGGCHSMLGRQKKPGQAVSIGKGCRLGQTTHEMSHALGAPHEHARSDRDDTIKVLYNNIPKSSRRNFNKANPTDNQIPYDLTSNMQYPFNRGGRGGPSMITLNPFEIRFMMTESSKLSFRDIKNLNLGYRCMEKWINQFPDSPICENEGYIGSKGKCICRKGTEGDRCEIKLWADYYPDLKCGGNITEPTLLQPNVTDENKNVDCMWWMKAPMCQKVELTVLDFQMKKPCQIHNNFFELRTDDPIVAGLSFRYCGDGLTNGQVIVSEKQDIFIHYNGKPGSSNFKVQANFISDPMCG